MKNRDETNLLILMHEILADEKGGILYSNYTIQKIVIIRRMFHKILCAK
jgi:hypothetical protein